MEISIRECAGADIHTLRDIGEKTYRAAFEHCNTEEDMAQYVAGAFTVEAIERQLTSPHSQFALAFQGDEAAGYLKLNYGPAQTELGDNSALEIERIYVSPDCQSRGVGQRLMEYALQKALDEGMEYVWLGVWEHNPRAIQFYERNGFYRFGEHIFRLGSDEQLDYLLRKDL